MMEIRSEVVGMGRKWWEGITKEHEQTFGGNGYVYSLNCADGFVGAYVSQNLLN